MIVKDVLYLLSFKDERDAEKQIILVIFYG